MLHQRPRATSALDTRLRPLRSLSLSKRILALTVVLFALGFSVLAIYLLDTSKQLRRAMAYVEAQALTRGFTAEDDINHLPMSYQGEEVSYTLYSADGEMLQYSQNLTSPRRLRQLLLKKDRWLPAFYRAGHVINVPVELADGSILMVARNDHWGRALIDQVLTTSLQRSLSIVLPMLALFALLLWGLLRWTLRPIKQAAAIANEITPDKPLYIPTDSLPLEIVPLARACNDAMGRLASAYQAEQRFVADAAHELRTPLSVLNLRLHRLDRNDKADIASMKHEMMHIRKLVDQLLELVRLEGLAEQEASSQPVDVIRVAREAIAGYLPLFEQDQRQLTFVTDAERVWQQGNAHLIGLVFTNLLENALHHGQGEVVVSIARERDQLVLCCQDEGGSPPLALRERLFDRFKKAQDNTRGSGLGLSIVRQIVHNLGGQVTFVETPTTCLEVRLPQAALPANEDTPRYIAQPLEV